MSLLLDIAATRDPQRRIDLARSDAAAGYVRRQPMVCTTCIVTGGDRQPLNCRDCELCLGLAAVFQQRGMQ